MNENKYEKIFIQTQFLFIHQNQVIINKHINIYTIYIYMNLLVLLLILLQL
jgi:hypothetical protein